ncbi:hypothetical protein GG344DRAFT_58641, partial [Lentinula edodes]
LAIVVLGRFNDAFYLEQPLLETSQRILGGEHPRILNRIQNLALTLQGMGRFNGALDFEQPSSLLETSKKVLVCNEPS